MALEDHSRLIRDAARTALSPLGFQQKGRSRVWYADRGFWALVIEFQPSGFGKGSHLNIAATWFWHPNSGWQFDYMHRAAGLVRFESTEQFRPEAERLANLAATEAAALDKKFGSLDTIACYLNEQASDERAGKSPRILYHAAIAAGLTGDPQFSVECFTRLMNQTSTVDWVKNLQAEVAILIQHLAEIEAFRAIIRKKVAEARSALKLPPLTL